MEAAQQSERNMYVDDIDKHNTQMNKNLILIGFGANAELMAHSEFPRFSRLFDGYNIHIFDLRTARQMLKKWKEVSGLKAFDKLSHNVMRADLFKYISLYHMGGFYLDIKSGLQPGKDVKCLEKLSKEAWFMLNSGNLIDNWSMFGERGSSLFKYVKTTIVSEILSGRTPNGLRFESKVFDTTGPVALRRIVTKYHNPNLQPSEMECLVYDVRGAGSSWKDPGSYHNVPFWKSVYVN